MRDITKAIGEEVAREVQEATLLGDEFYGFLPIQQEFPMLHLFTEKALSKIALLTKDPTEAVRLICMMVVTVLARANQESTMISGIYSEQVYIIKGRRGKEAESIYIYPLDKALDYINSVIDHLAPVGLKEWRKEELTVEHFALFPSPTIYLNFERAGMAISGTVVLNFQRDEDSRVTSDGKFLYTWSVGVSIKWPSSEYTPAGAQAVTALHQEIVVFASLLAGVLETRQVGQVVDKLDI